MINLRKRPMCWLAIGFLLIICILVLGRSVGEEPMEANQEVLLEGMVVSKEYKETAYGGYWQVVLKGVRVALLTPEETHAKETGNQNKNKTISLEGKYLCQMVKEEVNLKIGQRVLLNGKYFPWEKPTNEGQFDSQKYYVSQGILGQFKKGEILRADADYSLLGENMWRLRRQMKNTLVEQLGSEDGGLISAMLLGEKSSLTQEDKSLYQRNGISHILAISGLHLSLLGMGVYNVLLTVMPGKKQAAYSCIVIMSLYCVFTGNSISTIRATVMFALSLVATILGRSYDSLSALGFTAIILLFLNPYVLNNSGFLLSFLAVIGVTFVSPGLQELFSCKKKWSKSLCVSTAATLTTLPVVLMNYGTYPWYSVFLNMLILPAMSVLLLCAILLLVVNGGSVFAASRVPMMAGSFGVLTKGSAGMLQTIENILRWIIQGILGYFEFCCEAFEKLILQEGYTGAPGWAAVMLYTCLLFAVLSDKLLPTRFWRKMLLLCAVSILTMKCYWGLEVTMLDVGQGDGVVIRNSNGNVYLSDCGSSSVSKVGKYRLIPFLKHKGYGRIQGIFISHMDEDHMNGIVELLEMAAEEHIVIEYLFLPESVRTISEDWQETEELEALASETGAQVIYISQGHEMADGRLHFTCLYPKGVDGSDAYEYGSSGGNKNNSSLVLMMEYGEFDMLFTGDVEEEGERDIVRYLEQAEAQDAVLTEKSKEADVNDRGVDLEVLKVAHHGSSGSSCEEFLEAFKPRLSLISCGKNNSYGHPHEATLDRLTLSGSRILTTADCGAITINVSGKKVRVKKFKK